MKNCGKNGKTLIQRQFIINIFLIKYKMLLTWFCCLLLLYYLIKIRIRKTCVPNFQGKTIWITGASSGIGQYLTYQFCKRAAQTIIISARNINQLKRVKQNCLYPSKIKIVQLDMTDYQSIKETTKDTLNQLQRKGSKLDIIIQNAGILMRTSFIQTNFQNHLKLFKTNVDGPILHLKQILPHLMINKNPQIVYISSISGEAALANKSSYVGSKHAMNAILNALRVQLYQFNITVTNILPGYVRSNIGFNSLTGNANERKEQRDQDWEEGMKPQQFSQQAIKVIYRRQIQAHISKKYIVNPLSFVLRAVWPEFYFYWARFASKKQIK